MTRTQVLVWPSPATGILFVQTRFPGGTIEITDMAGRIMRREIMNDNIKRLVVQQLPGGLYTIRWILDGELFEEKFIKQ